MGLTGGINVVLKGSCVLYDREALQSSEKQKIKNRAWKTEEMKTRMYACLHLCVIIYIL